MLAVLTVPELFKERVLLAGLKHVHRDRLIAHVNAKQNAAHHIIHLQIDTKLKPSLTSFLRPPWGAKGKAAQNPVHRGHHIRKTGLRSNSLCEHFCNDQWVMHELFKSDVIIKLQFNAETAYATFQEVTPSA